MSLVFLKNDDTTSQKNGMVQKPYRFSNFLTQPIKIPPNSQVALVNASFTLNEQVNLDNNQPIYALTGQPILNMPYKIEMINNDFIDDWTQFFNELGEEITEMNPDNNFMYNITENGLVQPAQNLVPPLNPESRTQVTTPQGGLNWYLQNSGKSGLRVTQQADLMNDVFYQNFTSVIFPNDGSPADTTGLPLGPKIYQNIGRKINDLALNDVGTTISDDLVIEATDDGLNWLALGDTAEYQANPWSPRYVSFSSPGGSTGGFLMGTADANGGGTDWLNLIPDPSYFNTQFLWNDRLTNPSLPVGETLATYNTTFPEPSGGVAKDGGWAIQANKCCIKRAVGDTTPDIANNTFASGHQHIGHAGSGGYVVMGLEINEVSEANSVYGIGVMGSSDLVGPIGTTPFFAGVIPSACVYDREDADGNVLGSADSVYDFMKHVDLNNGDDNDPDGTQPGSEMFDRNNALCRYLFGVKLGFADSNGNRLLLQCQALKSNLDGGSMANSIYQNVNQPLLIPTLAQGTNTACDPHFQFEPNWAIGATPGPRQINTFGGPRSGVNLFLRFRWDTPYTMVCEFILAVDGDPLSYQPGSDTPYLPWDHASNPANNQDPRRGWCKLGSMNVLNNGTGGASREKLLIPTSFGDIIPVSYHTYTRSFTAWKGYFANLQSGYSRFPDTINNGSFRGFRNRSYWRSDTSQFASGMLGHSNLSLADGDASRTSASLLAVGIDTNQIVAEEGFDSTGRIKKDFQLLCLSTSISEDTEYWVYSNGVKRFTKGDPVGLAHGLAWGLQSRASGVESTLSFNIDGDPAEEYKIQTLDGIGRYINNVEVFSNHIQILNLPIQSANGVRSTQNKTVYIVPVFQDGQNQGVVDGNVTNSFAFSPPNLIWVDLNNYQEIDLNKIDILITDDNNEEQRSLSNKTDVTLIFRQKGSGDIGYLPINIPAEEPDIRKRIKEETKKNLIEY